jgi:hypothetical protein
MIREFWEATVEIVAVSLFGILVVGMTICVAVTWTLSEVVQW